MDPGEQRVSAADRLRALRADFAARARPIAIVRKGAYWHQRWAATFLRVVTFGGQRTYLSEYVTTLGHTIYVPDDFEQWDPARAWEVLRHEAVHVEQFERYGWFGMLLIYGFVFLPVGLAYGRAMLEMEAYRETLRAAAELRGLDAARDPELHDRIVKRFTGPDYAWMWPFASHVRAWIRATLDEIERQQQEIR